MCIIEASCASASVVKAEVTLMRLTPGLADDMVAPWLRSLAGAAGVELLGTHEDQLHTLAKALLEYETLSGEEIKTVLEGGSIDRGNSARPVVPPAGVGIPKTRKPTGFGGAAPAGA